MRETGADGSALVVAGLGGHALVAEQQARIAQPRGDELFQTQRGRRLATGEFGHESDAGGFDPLLQQRGLIGVEVERGGAIHGFAGVAGGQNGQRSEPATRQHHHRVDVFTLGQSTETVDRVGAEVARGNLGPMGNRLADCPNLEAVAERAQSRSMA